MKKISILLLVSIIIITGLSPTMAFGENGYDKKLEEMIIYTKELFNISDEYDVFDSSVSSYDGKTYFYLSWSDSEEKLDNIYVNVDNLGNIMSYNSFLQWQRTRPETANYTVNEAENCNGFYKIAKMF